MSRVEIDDLTILKSMQPPLRLVARLIGEMRTNTEIAYKGEIPLERVHEMVDEVVDNFMPRGVIRNDKSRTLVMHKVRALMQTHQITDRGELTTRGQVPISSPQVQPQLETSKLPMPTQATVQVNTEAVVPAEYIARAYNIGKLSPFERQNIAAIVATNTLEEAAKLRNIGLASLKAQLSATGGVLKLREVPPDARLKIIITMYNEWVRKGSVLPTRTSGRWKNNGNAPVEAKPFVADVRPGPDTPAKTEGSQSQKVEPATSEHSAAASVSVPLTDADIAGVPISIVLNSPEAGEQVASLMQQGYLPLALNEYVWPNGKHLVTYILAKRRC